MTVRYREKLKNTLYGMIAITTAEQPNYRFNSEGFSTLPQWLIAGCVAILAHILLLYNLRFLPDAIKPRAVTPIQVGLIVREKPKPVITQPSPQTAAPESMQPTQKKPEVRPGKKQNVDAPKGMEPTKSAILPSQTNPTPSIAEPASVPTNSENAVATPSQTTDEPIIGPQFNAAYLHNPKPVYPAAARRAGYEGEVVVRARVHINGQADQVQLVKSSGYEVLDRAALEAVRKWRFIPAKRANEPVTGWVEIPWQFKLEDE